MRIEKEINPDEPLTPTEKVALCAFIFWPLLFAFAVATLCGGCKEFYDIEPLATDVCAETNGVEGVTK